MSLEDVILTVGPIPDISAAHELIMSGGMNMKRSILAVSFASIIFLALIAPTRAMGATDIFLKFVSNNPALRDISGESTDAPHAAWIEPPFLRLGMENLLSVGSMGGGGGKATFEDLVIKKRPDKASSILFLAS